MLIKRLHSRGITTVVEAHGEVLFADGAGIGRFKQRLSARVREATIAAAPANKRPRWSYYGLPLKDTIRASTSTRITPGGGYFFIAVGSAAPHAHFVDQGTGIYNGAGPYEAKILPPWQHGSPSLYESTWRPNGPGTDLVGKVMIKGQKGQQFFERGLTDGFRSAQLRSFQLPGEGVSGMAHSFNLFPNSILTLLGPGRQNSPAFISQLKEWRLWRDTAWRNYEGLGRGGGVGSRAHQHHIARALAIKNAPGLAKLRASQAASAKRKQDQIDQLRKRDEAKALGRARKLEADRIRAEQVAAQKASRSATQRYNSELAKANAYAHEIERLLGFTTSVRANATHTIIRVSWTDANGNIENQDFAV